MPGKRITDHQVHQYKKDRNHLTQVAAAARAALSERSARRIEQRQSLPSQREPRTWRTRPDPLGVVWDAEVVPLLQTVQDMLEWGSSPAHPEYAHVPQIPRDFCGTQSPKTSENKPK